MPVHALKKTTMSNCPPECILAALPSSSSLVDPEAEDCHCLELKGCGGVKTQLSPQHECHSHVLLLQALLFWAKKRFIENLIIHLNQVVQLRPVSLILPVWLIVVSS